MKACDFYNNSEELKCYYQGIFAPCFGPQAQPSPDMFAWMVPVNDQPQVDRATLMNHPRLHTSHNFGSGYATTPNLPVGCNVGILIAVRPDVNQRASATDIWIASVLHVFKTKIHCRWYGKDPDNHLHYITPPRQGYSSIPPQSILCVVTLDRDNCLRPETYQALLELL